ncbi:hypothetical protein Avbf_05701 [Armadillidium vulgare]|nr:hypothetical protein Avbf_05701 [Armadillidium vulgare]
MIEFRMRRRYADIMEATTPTSRVLCIMSKYSSCVKTCVININMCNHKKSQVKTAVIGLICMVSRHTGKYTIQEHCKLNNVESNRFACYAWISAITRSVGDETCHDLPKQ